MRLNKLLKKTGITVMLLLVSMSGLMGQSSHFNYQAVINDPEGNPFEGLVGIKISILQPSANGDVVFSERHTIEADENGFVSFRVGEGDQVYTGEFDTIRWEQGPSFLRTEIAPGGGYSYSISSVEELTGAPMAMYAWKADTIASGFEEADPVFLESPASMISEEDTLKWNALSEKATYRVGDLFGGGVIFYVEPNGQHGLIASLSDVEVSPWGNAGVVTSAVSHYHGEENTTHIVNSTGEGTYAAYACDTLLMNGYDDWYLPAADEMYLLFRSRYVLNQLLVDDGNDDTAGLTADGYWTSTEKDGNEAYQFRTGNLKVAGKEESAIVRAIRAF